MSNHSTFPRGRWARFAQTGRIEDYLAYRQEKTQQEKGR